MAERGKDERGEQTNKLDAIIKKHEDLIPTVTKTQVKVDLYWKCYAYGDELKPHIGNYFENKLNIKILKYVHGII